MPRAKFDAAVALAYGKQDLLRVLPFGHTTLEKMIVAGKFPAGIQAYAGAHAIWPRVVVEEWLRGLKKLEV